MTTITEKQNLRRQLIDACMEKQQQLIDNFRDRIKTLTEAEGLGNEESYDNDVLAKNAEKVAEINTLNELLEFANSEMRILENLRETETIIRDIASPGAVVVTDRGIFFVSASLEHFRVNGDPYIGISTNSPLYRAMEGASKGDTFSFKGTEYRIRDVF